MKTIALSPIPAKVQPPAELEARVGTHYEGQTQIQQQRFVDLQFVQRGEASFSLRIPAEYAKALAREISKAAGVIIVDVIQ